MRGSDIRVPLANGIDSQGREPGSSSVALAQPNLPLHASSHMGTSSHIAKSARNIPDIDLRRPDGAYLNVCPPIYGHTRGPACYQQLTGPSGKL